MLFSQITSALREWSGRCRPGLRSDAFLHRWGALVVAVFAALYYATYYRSGLNLGGEGGTVAVVAMRLMDGWLPIKDTFLGYNVMWFYPVVWLFGIFGPNYIALRIFFFVLCALTGVMAFFIVRRATGSGWYATLTALLPVVIPGMLFRNYMGFLAVLNMLLLLHAWVFVTRNVWTRVGWMFGAGLGLGLTLLIRIDLGIFFVVLTLGLALLDPLGKSGGFGRNLSLAAAGILLAAAGAAALHAPFVWDARQRGYAKEFAGQYTGWAGLIRSLLAQKIGVDVFAPPPASRPVYTPSRVQLIGLWLAARDAGPNAPTGDIVDSEYRQKKTIEDWKEEENWSERALVVVTYLPIAVAGVVVIPAAFAFLAACWRRDAACRERALVMLVTTGSALTLFPQFFFFRPDTPHLSELMVPFFVAMACAGWFGVRAAASGPTPGRILGAAVAGLCALTTGLYVFHALPKESAGTWAARGKRNREMTAQNGVRVWLKKGEREEIQELADRIARHTRPGDYVACYPYQPTVNFLTDRPAYEYNLYIDNAHNVARFHEETLEKIARFRPAAIVVDNRPVNQTEESRFRNWAASTYEWIRDHYRYAGTYRRQELYFRPDLAPPDTDSSTTTPSP